MKPWISNDKLYTQAKTIEIKVYLDRERGFEPEREREADLEGDLKGDRREDLAFGDLLNDN